MDIRVFIKFLFIIICALYAHSRFFNNNQNLKDLTRAVIFTISACVLISVAHNYLSFVVIVLSLFMLIIFTHITYKCDHITTITSSLIVLGLSYFLYYLATLFAIVIIIVSVLLINDVNIVISHLDKLLILYQLIIGVFQLFLSKWLFKRKYFRNAATILLSTPHNLAGTILATIILLAATSFYFFEDSNYLFWGATLFFGGFGILLAYWWRTHLKTTYINELHKKEILIRDKEIELLKKDNERLSALVHKDNKLIPAMEMAIRGFISTHNESDSSDAIHERAAQLLDELNDISSQRQGILQTQLIECNTCSTNVVCIDSMLNYMRQKAASYGISLDIIINVNIQLITEHIIPKEHLSAIIGDLLDNAIIATRDSSSRNILLLFDTIDSHYRINVYDSGIPFESHTLLKLGTERTTTHEDTGGSGIGLMNTLGLVRKHRASFCIDEKLGDNTYTKNISICFDGLKKVIFNT